MLAKKTEENLGDYLQSFISSPDTIIKDLNNKSDYQKLENMFSKNFPEIEYNTDYKSD